MTRFISALSGKKIIQLAIFGSVLFFAPKAFAATLSLSPAGGSYQVDQVFTVNINLDTQAVAIDGVDILYLNYNPLQLEVQDANTGIAGTQITAGSLMPNTVANSVDTTLGRISFSQVPTGGTTYAGSGVLASVSFKAKAAGTATASFNFTLSSTTDTNVASNGSDVLTAASGASFTLTGISVSPTPTPTATPTNTPGGSSGSPGYSGAPSNPVNPTPNPGNAHPNQCLINSNGTYYLITNNQRRGITNPGMLFSHGYDFKEGELSNSDDALIPEGPLLLPDDGALVKKPGDPTVFLISGGEKHGFVSGAVFTKLGYNFGTVLTVTAPELDLVPLGEIISDGNARHHRGVKIIDNGAVFFMGNSVRYPYPSMEVYNSWNLDNDFSRVVPANAADRAVPIGEIVTKRLICGK